MVLFRFTPNRLAVATALALVPTAVAFPAVAKIRPATQQKAAQKAAVNQQKAAANQQGAAVAGELRSAHALLMNADHDYQGHRAKAAHEVAQAIHELTGHHHQHKATGNNAAGQPRPKMAQAASDAHLTQAAQILSTALGQMPAGHKATAKVQLALNEIHTALKIK